MKAEKSKYEAEIIKNKGGVKLKPTADTQKVLASITFKEGSALFASALRALKANGYTPNLDEMEAFILDPFCILSGEEQLPLQSLDANMMPDGGTVGCLKCVCTGDGGCACQCVPC